MTLDKYCADPKDKFSVQGSNNESVTHDNSGRRGRHSRKRVWILSILALLLLGFAGFVIIPLVKNRAPHTALIRVPRNANEQMLQDSVAKYMGEDFARDVRKALPIASGGSKLRYGAWRIDKGMTAIAAAHKLAKGGQTGVRVTFNNERTLEQLAEKVAAKLDIPKDSMMAAFNDDRLLNELRTDRDHVICLFLADTYEFYWTATPQEVLQKLRKNYDHFWTPERIDRVESMRMLPREMVTLASIVDEETNLSSEKGTVGRLYLNRLNKGMKLQADPTVRYAIGDFSIRRITHEMLDNPSPYNTYRYEGLPPGPIRVTSGSTIDAILSSRPHGYLYMCASEDFSGHHNFAVDYDTHMANARRYQQALDQRGIK